MHDHREQLNQLALRQHSVFLTRQALDLGFSRFQIQERLDRQVWLRLQKGLLRLPGRPFDAKAKLSAALLTVSGSVVSHESAAHLHELEGFHQPGPAVVTTTGTNGESRFAAVHRYQGLTDIDLVTRSGLPTTTVALTLFHLSAVLSERVLGRLVDSCIRRKLVELPDMFALADFWTRLGRPRRQIMRRLLSKRGDRYVPAESELEAAFLDLVARHDLTPPVRQFQAPWLERSAGRIDFAYPCSRLLVEVDGRAFHTREADFARDRARDRLATLNGWSTMRYTWDEVTRRGAVVVAELRSALTGAQLTG